jgi:hypothetical protein
MKNTSQNQTGSFVRLLPSATLLMAGIILIGSCDKTSLVIDASIKPPKPDTHYVSLKDFNKLKEIEVDFLSNTVAASKAFMMGPNNEVLSTVQVEPSGKSDMSAKANLHHMKAVFPLDNAKNINLIKVTIPNTESFPEGNETLFIKIR